MECERGSAVQQLIFDIGMHSGEDTEFYLKKGFRVVAVEAHPALAEAGEKKFAAELESGQLAIVKKAIVDDDTDSIDFFINEKKTDWGTVHPDWNRSMNDDFTTISVPALRLEEIVSEYGMPYFMKIDIEGADIFCLRSLQRIGEIPTHVSVEMMTPNNLVDGEVECMEILCILRALGYNQFQISDQSKLKSVRCPSPALEGEYVDYQFGNHSSGLFGKELQTPSYSLDEVAEHYLDYFYKRKQSLLSKLTSSRSASPFHRKGWFDIHARRA